jgi:corrinoid protein of di/trimethylamine methyltransferase
VASKERTNEILKQLHDAVVDYDEERAAKWAQIALDEGVDAYTAIMDGLVVGMVEVSERYNRKEYFVPELLVCADALNAGLKVLQPHTKGRETKVKGKIIIGTVEGDVHDIGKNLVKLMFQVAGWTVYDLGKDVKLDRFAEQQLKTGADIVALSALMTTSMLAIPKAIELIRAKNPKVAIMVGGAPLSEDIAKKYGADGYAPDAGKVVDEAVKMLTRLKKTPAKK